MLSMTRICQVNATQIFSKHVMVAQAAFPSMCTLRSRQITFSTSTVPVRHTRTAYRRGFKTTGHDLEWSVENQKLRSRNFTVLRAKPGFGGSCNAAEVQHSYRQQPQRLSLSKDRHQYIENICLGIWSARPADVDVRTLQGKEQPFSPCVVAPYRADHWLLQPDTIESTLYHHLQS